MKNFDFAQRFRAIRKSPQVSLSQEQFGKLIGWSLGVVKNAETGRKRFRPEYVAHIATALQEQRNLILNEEWFFSGRGRIFLSLPSSEGSQTSWGEVTLCPECEFGEVATKGQLLCCPYDGAPLTVKCSQCQTPFSVPDQRYCSRCGNPIRHWVAQREEKNEI